VTLRPFIDGLQPAAKAAIYPEVSVGDTDAGLLSTA